MTIYNKTLLTVIIAVSSLTNLSAMYEPERRPNREQQELDRAIALSLQDQWGFVGQDEGYNRQEINDDNNNNNIDEDLRKALEFSAREEEQRAMFLNQEQDELDRALRLSEQESKAKAHQDELDRALYDLVAQRGYPYEIQEIIDKGAGLDVLIKRGDIRYPESPLHRAARKGYLELCELLLVNGADVNAQDEGGHTALIWTVRKGHLAVCKALIENGADVNVRSNDGNTALMGAVWNTYFAVCELLIENGAAFNIINNEQKSALSYAAKKGHTVLCKLIIENACWACPSKDEVDISRARLKEFLLCMKRLTKKSKVPKDIKFFIFQSHPELERDFVHVLYYDLCQGKQIGNWMDVLKSRVADYTLGELKLFMDCAALDLSYANQELKSILDSTVLEENFGNVIRTNINERLGLMNAQAQEK